MSQSLVRVYMDPDFQRRVELVAAQVAMTVALDAQAPAQHKALARQVLMREIPREDMAFAIISAPDVSAAALADPVNPGGKVTDAILAEAFTRNWGDFAAIRIV